jgi:hypothetical protein
MRHHDSHCRDRHRRSPDRDYENKTRTSMEPVSIGTVVPRLIGTLLTAAAVSLVTAKLALLGAELGA